MDMYRHNLSDILGKMVAGWELVGFEESHRGSYFWCLQLKTERGYKSSILTVYTDWRVLQALQDLIRLHYTEADGMYDHYRLNDRGRALAALLK